MPPPIRLAGEAALLVFVAVGLALAGFSSIVIAVVVLGALVFVVAFERFRRKATTVAEGPAAKPQLPRTPGVPTPEAPQFREAPARGWNVWELQRAVRDSADERREEWNALLIHLREFANADGDLPPEFDGLVRESFAGVLTSDREPAATA